MNKQLSLSQALDQQLSGFAGVGIENNDVVLNVDIERPVDDEGVPVDTADTPEAELVDAQQEEAEVVETEDKLETLQDTEESLESIRADVARFASAGGMTQDVAGVMHSRVLEVTARAGVSLEAYMPSLESYGGSANQYATTVSLENKVTDALRAFWKWISETVAKLWEQLKSWAVKITSAVRKFNVRAKALLREVAKINGEAKEGGLEGGIAKAVYVESGTIAQAAVNLEKLAQVCLDAAPNKFTNFAASSSVGTFEAASELEKGAAKIDGRGIKEVFGGFAQAVTSTKIKSGNAGIAYLKGNPMLGGKAFALSDASAIPDVNLTGDVKDGSFIEKFINSVDSVAKVVRACKAEVVSTAGDKAKAAKEAPVASKADMKTILDAVIGATDAAYKYEQAYAKREAAAKEIVKYAADEAKAADKGEQANVQAIKANGKLALIIWQSVGQIERVALSAVASQSKTYLEYVTASMKQYGAEAPKAEGEGEGKKEGEAK